MKLLQHIPSWVKNKYFIAIAAFAVIMLFFDKNDVFTKSARNRQLRELEESKAFYTKEIEEERTILEQLKSNPAALEQYAREKHLMKRDNEDLFLVPENPVNENN